jgi:hypothetical protein
MRASVENCLNNDSINGYHIFADPISVRNNMRSTLLPEAVCEHRVLCSIPHACMEVWRRGRMVSCMRPSIDR